MTARPCLDIEGREIRVGDLVRNLETREERIVERILQYPVNNWLAFADGVRWMAHRCLVKARGSEIQRFVRAGRRPQ